MAVDPNIYQQLQIPNYGATLIGGLEAGGRMAANKQERNLQEMRLSDLLKTRQQEEEDKQQLQSVMSQTEGDPARAIKALLAAGTPKSIELASKLHTLLPKEESDTMNMTEIIDPKDPSKLLRINARVYKGGSIGSPGVIGYSGKEPTAAKREEEAATGAKAVDNIIADLRDKYSQLGASGGITDPKKGLISNIQAGIASSGPGQLAGRLAGTQNQSLRNQIAQTRPLLLAAIKQRTGMSAKQMDSNVELKLWLAVATDPTLDIEANLNALNNIEKMIGSGELGNNPEGKAPTQPEQPTAVYDAEKEARYQAWKAQQGKK